MAGEDVIGNRMKGYEKEFDFTIPASSRVILRLDGNSFSKLTRSHFVAPFDDRFKDSMYRAAIAVLEYCHGKIAYVQSDEINVLFDDRGEGNEILNNRIQKICSLVASACAVKFSKAASAATGEDIDAQFDCRCFAIPIDEVIGYYVWRQRDAMKNAVNSIYYWKMRETMKSKAAEARSDGVSNDEKEAILDKEHGVKIGQYPLHYIRGAVVYNRTILTPIEEVAPPGVIEKYKKQGQLVTRHEWFVDKAPPVFAGSGYIQQLTGIRPAGTRPVDQ